MYVKLQPYIQTSVAPRANQKLSYRFFGPYKVLEQIGSVAYKLQLPEQSTVHPVFHVSQLKGAIPVSHSASPLPVSFTGLQVPQKILQKRVATVGSDVRLQALIQWSGMPAALATWEDVEGLRQRFPRAPAWGQAGSYRGGDVSNPAPTAPSHGNNKIGDGHAQVHGVAKEVTHGPKPRRGTRERRPSSRIQGPEWE